MARKSIPKYRKQKTKSGIRAFVELSGIRFYLGEYGSDESRVAYTKAINEWEECRRQIPVKSDELTITELSARFLLYCKDYYQSQETANIKSALRAIVGLYGDDLVINFGPLALRAVGRSLIENNHSRKYVNRIYSKIKMMFKWGVAEELLPSSSYEALRCVSGLKFGRTEARECDPVEPVADDVVDHTLQYMTPTVQAMVRLQRLCGARPGEIVQMRTCDLDMSAAIWLYKPQTHKTLHHGKKRIIYLGPKCQDVLTPHLKHNLQEYIYSPIQADRERRDTLHAKRKTPISCGNVPGSAIKRNPKKKPTERYTATTYARAISYSCQKAYPALVGSTNGQIKAWDKDHRWTPNQLRHAYATEVRRDHGLEASQILLGHSQANTTEIYAQRDTQKALDVARMIG